jgi:hypothetical protein
MLTDFSVVWVRFSSWSCRHNDTGRICGRGSGQYRWRMVGLIMNIRSMRECLSIGGALSAARAPADTGEKTTIHARLLQDLDGDLQDARSH